MIGRTPASITAMRPLRHGVIADFEVTEQMLRHFMERVHSSRHARPRVMMCAPSGITDVEQRALTEACLAAGARSVHLIEEPIAAAIGAGLAIDEPRANVVLDVGGGTSEVAVMSLGGIVVSQSLRVGGYDLDDAAAAWLRRTHGLAIGETTAERVKLEVGSVAPDRSDAHSEVKGRDPITGLPRQVLMSSDGMREALEDRVAEIIAAVIAALEETPPSLRPTFPSAESCWRAEERCYAGWPRESSRRPTSRPASRIPRSPAWRRVPARPSTKSSCSSARAPGRRGAAAEQASFASGGATPGSRRRRAAWPRS